MPDTSAGGFITGITMPCQILAFGRHTWHQNMEPQIFMSEDHQAYLKAEILKFDERLRVQGLAAFIKQNMTSGVMPSIASDIQCYDNLMSCESLFFGAVACSGKLPNFVPAIIAQLRLTNLQLPTFKRQGKLLYVCMSSLGKYPGNLIWKEIASFSSLHFARN